jgi:SAM-dependent methyltransferase
MRYEFCTLFDVNYLPRGVALYHSLARVCPDFQLRVFCMDEEAERILRELELPQMTVIPLEELERHDRELLEIKPTRTQLEYCWTATPAVSLYCLETEPDLTEITYLDADLMFFSDPAPVFEEMGDDSVIIVPHRYAAQWQSYEETSGIFNVQFMTFRRDERGLEALHWWHDRCIEWCYYRLEDGKLGDQKYLDDWPVRFEGVHVLEHPGGGLAPWNAERYRIEERGGKVVVDGRPLVFYHYHSLKLFKGITGLRLVGLLSNEYQVTRRPVPLVWRQNYPMSAEERKLVWDPYLHELGQVLSELRRRHGRFDHGFVPVDPRPIIRSVAARARLPLRRALAIAAALRHRGVSSEHRESWKSPAVAQQMDNLAEQQLGSPEDVAPYRTFVEAIGRLASEHALPERARLLDFGCGVGHYSELLERYFPGRFAYIGCDFSQAMVEAARARWPQREFVLNDIFENELDLESFDVIVAGALIDVLDEWERALDVLLGSGASYVLLHRQQVVDDDSHVEIVGGYTGQLTYRTYVTRRELLAIGARNGYELVEELEVDGPVRTFLFGRVDE